MSNEPGKTLGIGLAGFGTVGTGVWETFERNAELISSRSNVRVEIMRIAVRDINKTRPEGVPSDRFTTDWKEVVDDPAVDIVVELIGGTTTAFDIVAAALRAKKPVVTGNKALLAERGQELFALSSELDTPIHFEAAVAGGIPIIKTVQDSFVGNRIQSMVGIINGTSNYILERMTDAGLGYEEALGEAQQLGYAEADPTFDVEGIDAAHKLTILASLAFGIELQFEKTYTEGISKVTTEDVNYAEELGYRIKHLGITRKTAKGIELRVHPTLIPEKRLIANVDGVMNAVLVQGDAVGPTLYYGAGAGAEPTASAVVADIIDTVRTIDAPLHHKVPLLGFQDDAMRDTPILPIEDVESAYYLRMEAEDHPGVLAEVSDTFAKNSISIEAVIQKEPATGENTVHLIMLTQKCVESNVNQAIAAVEELSSVEGDVVRIRMERLG